MKLFTNLFLEPAIILAAQEDIRSSETDTAVYVIARNSGEGMEKPTPGYQERCYSIAMKSSYLSIFKKLSKFFSLKQNQTYCVWFFCAILRGRIYKCWHARKTCGKICL